MSKKVLILTGGTGGHIIPAVNFGNYLIKEGYDSHIIMDKRGKKFSTNFLGKKYIVY